MQLYLYLCIRRPVQLVLAQEAVLLVEALVSYLLFSYCNITRLTMLFGKSSVPFIQYFSLDTLLDICLML